MKWPTWIYKLNDPNDRWFGTDKAHHLGLAAVLWTMFTWAVGDPLAGWFAVWTAGIMVEIVQVARWARWVRTGRHDGWPAFADKISLKDILADLAGAGISHLVYFLVVVL